MQLIKEKKQIKNSTLRLGCHLSLQTAVVTVCAVPSGLTIISVFFPHSVITCFVMFSE